MLCYALLDYDGPIAIRYPRGAAYTGLSEYNEDIAYGKAEIIHKGGGSCASCSRKYGKRG